MGSNFDFRTVLLAATMIAALVSCQAKDRVIYQKEAAEPRDQSQATVGKITSYPLVFSPQRPQGNKLFVVLHGCSQSAETMAAGTQFDRLAERDGAVVLYPQVPAGAPEQCWSWFRPENQRRDSGQLKMIVDEVQATITNFAMHDPQVFAVGFSSGAAMVSGLLACYPELFAGGAIHSGVAYAAAKTPKEATKVLSAGPPAGMKSVEDCDPKSFRGRVLVMQGAVDKIVNPKNALALVRAFNTKDRHADRTFYSNGSAFTVSDYFAQLRGPRIRLITVANLDHAWSGANLSTLDPTILGMERWFSPGLPFFSKIGPNATDLIWRYFAGDENTFPNAEEEE